MMYTVEQKITNQKGKIYLSLRPHVVLDLLSVVAIPSNHTVFYDNYFTSCNLLKILKQQGYRATGTIREKRTKKCRLTSTKIMKKQQRETFKHKYDSTSIVVYLTFHSRFQMAHACQKRPNLHTNELNTTVFCSTSPLKAPNRLKPLKLATRFVLTSCDIYQNPFT
jgi:hypothetical protein